MTPSVRRIRDVGIRGQAVRSAPPSAWRRWLPVGLVGLVLVVHGALIRQAFAYPAGSWLTDSGDYLALADSIRLRGEFTTGSNDNYDRAFGYPLFLAAFLSLPSKGLEAALATQQILTLAECALLYRAGSSSFGGRVGGAAALWLALSPNSLFWAGTIMSETLASFWLVAAFCLLIESLRVLNSAPGIGSGAAMGLATLTRPIALYLLPAWALLAGGAGRREDQRALRVRLASLFLVAGLLPIALWIGRNYIVLGRPIISTSPARTLRDFQLARVVADVEGISRDDATALMARYPDPTAYGWRVALDNPGTFLKVSGIGVLRTAAGTELGTWLIVLGYVYPGTGMLEALAKGSLAGTIEAVKALAEHEAGWLSFVLLAWGLAYTVGVFVSAALGLRRASSLWGGRRWAPIGLAAVAAAYLILIPLANGDARFRVPAEPFLAFLAGLAWWRGDPAMAPETIRPTESLETPGRGD